MSHRCDIKQVDIYFRNDFDDAMLAQRDLHHEIFWKSHDDRFDDSGDDTGDPDDLSHDTGSRDSKYLLDANISRMRQRTPNRTRTVLKVSFRIGLFSENYSRV